MNEELLKKLIELAKYYKVTKLVQFGSSLDSFDECKDIDFACDGLYDKNFFKFGAKLEELFNKPVDLVPLQPTDKFIESILKQGVVLYESTAN
jgi:predicted nucleotidyltransferase